MNGKKRFAALTARLVMLGCACLCLSSCGWGKKKDAASSENVRRKRIVAICTNDAGFTDEEKQQIESLASKSTKAVGQVEQEFNSAVAEAKQNLSLYLGISFVNRNKLQEVMKENAFQLSDWSSDEKTAEIGRALNAVAIVTISPHFNCGTYSSGGGWINLHDCATDITNINTLETFSFSDEHSDWNGHGALYKSKSQKKKLEQIKRYIESMFPEDTDDDWD